MTYAGHAQMIDAWYTSRNVRNTDLANLYMLLCKARHLASSKHCDSQIWYHQHAQDLKQNLKLQTGDSIAFSDTAKSNLGSQ